MSTLPTYQARTSHTTTGNTAIAAAAVASHTVTKKLNPLVCSSSDRRKNEYAETLKVIKKLPAT